MFRVWAGMPAVVCLFSLHIAIACAATSGSDQVAPKDRQSVVDSLAARTPFTGSTNFTATQLSGGLAYAPSTSLLWEVPAGEDAVNGPAAEAVRRKMTYLAVEAYLRSYQTPIIPLDTPKYTAMPAVISVQTLGTMQVTASGSNLAR